MSSADIPKSKPAMTSGMTSFSMSHKTYETLQNLMEDTLQQDIEIAMPPISEQTSQPTNTLELSNNKSDDDNMPKQMINLIRNKSHTAELKEERYMRLAITIIIFIFVISMGIFVEIIPNINILHLMTIMLVCSYTIWISHFLLVLVSFKHLHRVRVRRKTLEDCMRAHLFIPYGYEENEYISNTSVSELLALRGSNIEKVGNMHWDITFVVIFCAVFMRWTQEKNKNNQISVILDIELLLLLFSAISVWLMPAWALEKGSALQNVIHYVLSVSYVAFAPLSFCIYQQWSDLSIILLCLAYIPSIIFLILMEFVQKLRTENLSIVHRNSLIVVSIELLSITFTYITYILYVYCMANNDIILKLGLR